MKEKRNSCSQWESFKRWLMWSVLNDKFSAAHPTQYMICPSLMGAFQWFLRVTSITGLLWCCSTVQKHSSEINWRLHIFIVQYVQICEQLSVYFWLDSGPPIAKLTITMTMFRNQFYSILFILHETFLLSILLFNYCLLLLLNLLLLLSLGVLQSKFLGPIQITDFFTFKKEIHFEFGNL